MKKLFPFYIAATACLFFAIFSTLTLLGVGAPPPEPERAVAETPLEPEPIDLGAGLDFPDLEPGRMYSVSHRTPIVEDYEGPAGGTQELGPGGIFMVDDSFPAEEVLWYRITVSGGFEDYTMYLKAESLNWQDVRPYYTEEERAVAKREEGLKRFKELFAERSRSRSGAEEAAEREPEPGPAASERAVAGLEGVVSRVSTQGAFTAALAAAVFTFALVFVISFTVWFRSSRKWSRNFEFDDFNSELGESSEDPYREMPGEDDDGPF